ncbi:MAG: hypothetical protein U0625_08040 [Phycisphaerales bacterium]
MARTQTLIGGAVLAATLLTTTAANADTVVFQTLTGASSANDMSPDGRWICGEATSTGNFAPYIYDAWEGTMTYLPTPGLSARAISDDGRVVLGSMEDPETGADVAAIWRASTNTWESLGYLPGGGLCPSRSSGYELSADGSVAVGLSWINGCHAVAFRWTEQTGMVAMDVLANGGNRASVVSANGSLLAGFAQGSFERTPAIWGSGGAGTLLDPPSGDAVGEVTAMNASGTIVLGQWNGKATKWTNGLTVRTQIGNGSALPGWIGAPMGISNSGTIVGFDFLVGSRIAWIQPSGQGPIVMLSTYITSNGGTIPQGTSLEVAQAISADGSRIIGHGFNGAWMVTIADNTACVADIAPVGGDLVVNGADLGALLGAWGGTGGDLNGDGTTDGADLGILLGSWGACPMPTGACCVDGVCSQKTAEECAQAGGTFLGNYTPCGPAICANNDACADAIDVTANLSNGVAIHGDSTAATPPKFGGPDPELPAGSPTCHWDNFPDAAHSTVWYKFTAPESGALRIWLCDSEAIPFTDSTVGVYSGTCGSLVEIACDEDGCGGEYPYYSDLTVTGLNPGEVYYICVMNPGDWGGSMAGPFVLKVEPY